MAAQQQLIKLYGPQAQEPDFQFLVIHMRLGGMEHEKSLKSTKGGEHGPLLDLIHGLTCIENLGEALLGRVSRDPRKGRVRLTVATTVAVLSQ